MIDDDAFHRVKEAERLLNMPKGHSMMVLSPDEVNALRRYWRDRDIERGIKTGDSFAVRMQKGLYEGLVEAFYPASPKVTSIDSEYF